MDASAVKPRSPCSLVGYTPISGAVSYFYQNKTPYSMGLNVTVERQIAANTVASASYVGSLGRHLLTVESRKPSLNLAQVRGEDFGRVLTRHGIGRFLYRLVKSQYRDQFILKGALLFEEGRRKF